MRPFHTCSVPIRSNAIQFLREHRATRQGRAEEELVLVDSPPHRGRGQAGATIAIEIGVAHTGVVCTGNGGCLARGQRDLDGLQEQAQDGRGVV